MLVPIASLVNGVKTQQIDIQNRGLAFGDGVFETMRLEKGTIPLLDLHKARLRSGLNALGLNYSDASLARDLAQLFDVVTQANVSTARVKLIVSRGQGGQGVIPSQDAGVDVAIIAYASTLTAWVQPSVALKTSDVLIPHNTNLAGLKHLNRLDYVLAAQAAKPIGNEQVLLLDVAGNVVETLHHNVFFILGGNVITPALNRCGVNGVFKQFLMSVVLPETGGRIIERDINLAEAKRCDACFITNAYSGLTPVSGIDGQHFEGDALLAAISAELTQALGEK